MQEVVECPKCGKRTIVQRNPDVFLCLNCDFQRDFSRSQFRDKNKGYAKTPSQSSSIGGTRNDAYISSYGGGYSKAEMRKENSDGGFLGFLLFIAMLAIFIL